MTRPDLIDPAARAEANWLSTVFLTDPERLRPSGFGLCFQNIDAGAKIFEAWRDRLGEFDRNEELRVAFIEGEIPGLRPGYSIAISARTDRAVHPFAENTNFLRMAIAARMTLKNGSRHLTEFKADLALHQRYFLLPVSADLNPHFGLALEKAEIHFRNISEITQNDIDAVILPKGRVHRG